MTAVDSGEVAVQQNHHTHALQASGLDGTIDVNLDEETPVVSVPDGIRVQYRDEDALATDGGTVEGRTETAVEGVGLSDQLTQYALAGGSLLLISAGWLSANTSLGSAIAAGVGGLLLIGIASGRTGDL